MHRRDIERQIRDASEQAGQGVRQSATGAVDNAQDLIDRGRRRIQERFGAGNGRYRRQLTRVAEDLADETNYHYRRMRRQVNRHPVATVAIVAGPIGAFLLLGRASSSDED